MFALEFTIYRAPHRALEFTIHRAFVFFFSTFNDVGNGKGGQRHDES
jgi:hypothetical protein